MLRERGPEQRSGRGSTIPTEEKTNLMKIEAEAPGLQKDHWIEIATCYHITRDGTERERDMTKLHNGFTIEWHGYVS